MASSYHHGNLREALIKAGLKYVNENGEDALSLRKVASACGVSHSAPYAHFADKDDLLSAIKNTVTQQFSNELKRAVEEKSDESAEAKILAMGKSYVMFFAKHPDYFYFLFHKQNLEFHMQMEEEHEGDYEPFLIFKGLFKQYIKDNNLEWDEKRQELELLKTWSVVQGFSSIACMNNVHSTLDWTEIIEKSLK